MRREEGRDECGGSYQSLLESLLLFFFFSFHLWCTTGGGEVKKIRENAVYVSGLADGITEEGLGQVFGAIGQIKVREGMVAKLQSGDTLDVSGSCFFFFVQNDRKTNKKMITLYRDKQTGRFKV